MLRRSVKILYWFSAWYGIGTVRTKRLFPSFWLCYVSNLQNWDFFQFLSSTVRYYHCISFISRVVGIKFKPKKTNQMVELSKWLDSKEGLSGSLTITELTKIYRFLLWKFVGFERRVLVFAYIIRNAHFH